MKRTALAIATIALFAMASPVAASTPHEEAAMLALINEERAAEGLAPLVPYFDLEDDASAHSATMKATASLHHNPDLGSVTTGWFALGENVGVGPDVVSLHGAFMASPGHRANVLGSYNYAGVGIVEDGSRIWVTIVFMRGPAGLVAEPVVLARTATDVGLVDPTQGRWYLRDHDGAVNAFYYGNAGDYPMMGDWDCDGVATPGLYRRSDGFVYLRNSNTAGIADVRFYFGNPGDLPIAGDFNGDGCDTVSIYRQKDYHVYIINELGSEGKGLGAADYSFAMGGPGVAVVVGDFDGDGMDTPVTAPLGSLAGDWDGDGTASLGNFAGGMFTLEGAESFAFGTPGWLPVSGQTG